MFPSTAVLRERSGTGRIAYLGMDLDPKALERGKVARVRHYFRVDAPPSGDYDVFVHGEIPGGGGRPIVADHAPAEGRFLTSRWKTGEIWPDEHNILVPNDVSSATLELFVGMFKGNTRLTVEAPPGASDGQDRIKVATIAIGGAAPSDELPAVTIKRATKKITADGVLDEADWANAEVMTFADTMEKRPIQYPTKLRLLYDDENLYVGFESTDADITDPFKNRDDPIYDHECVEVYLMPNVIAPAIGPYVEMQASPSGVIFDAAFTGRRQGMDKSFNAGQTVGTKIDGTLNGAGADRGWVSEWVVPWKGIRGVQKPPVPGDEWRGNAYRIEKHSNGAEYSAWSPPRVGDFHNIVRFGRMKFGS
jgi:hypothetical protein